MGGSPARGQLGILQRGRTRQQIKPLENKPELLIPNQCQHLFAMLGNIDPLQQILSGAGTIQASEYVHERGFAAPAGAHDGQKFPALNLQTHSTQRVHACFAQFVVLVNVFDLYDRARRRCGYPSVDLVGRLHRFVGSFRGADAQRLNAPGACVFGITDRIMSASPSFSSPLISAVTCVYAWSVIPRETFTGSMVLSACSFQTTAFSARGARGRF